MLKSEILRQVENVKVHANHDLINSANYCNVRQVAAKQLRQQNQTWFAPQSQNNV